MLKFSMDRDPRSHDESGRPWYDTKEGVALGLTNLAAFNNLINARHDAAYDREEELNEFTVLGRYLLDTCGNCGIITWPADFESEFPNVLTAPEFYSYFEDKEFLVGFSVNLEGIDLIPPARLTCAYCGVSWSINNCHDVINWSVCEETSLTGFVGQRLSKFKEACYQDDSGIYGLSGNSLKIQNDKNIDLTLKYPNAQKIWERGLVVNEHGIIGLEEGLTDDYIIQAGDKALFSVSRFFHHQCNRFFLFERFESYYRNIFEAAGFKLLGTKEIPNEYCGCERCSPWFLITTNFGVIKIGWRKRVINIDWSALADSSIASLFEDESVTRGENFIHAWGLEKTQEYLSKICKHLENK